jgi:hypothetical protein
MLVWLASPLGAAFVKGHPASSLGNRPQPDDPIRDMSAEAAAGLHQHCVRLHLFLRDDRFPWMASFIDITSLPERGRVGVEE